MKTSKAKKQTTLLLMLVAVILSMSYVVFKSMAHPAKIAEITSETPESPEVVLIPSDTNTPLVYGGSPAPSTSSAPAIITPSPSVRPSLVATTEETIAPEKPEVFVMTPENVIPLVYRVNTPGIFIPGDLNQDHYVNLADYSLLISKYGNPYTLADYNNIIKNFGKTSQ
jgi:hypothetical protein